MGSGVTASCKCGYKKDDILIGGGMRTFKENCSFPALCKKCDDLVAVNLLAKSVKCPKCKSSNIVPYNKKELTKKKGNKRVTSWHVEKLGGDLYLTNGSYYCPACKKFTLSFEDSELCWD